MERSQVGQVQVAICLPSETDVLTVDSCSFKSVPVHSFRDDEDLAANRSGTVVRGHLCVSRPISRLMRINRPIHLCANDLPTLISAAISSIINA